MRSAAAPVLLVALLAGCGTETPGDADTKAVGSSTPGAFPHADYTFVYSRACFCRDRGVRIRVTVEDGEAVSAEYVDGPNPDAAGEPPEPQRITLDDVIALSRTKDAAQVDVEWPHGQEYPDRVWVDYDELTVDEEMGYQIHRVDLAG